MDASLGTIHGTTLGHFHHHMPISDFGGRTQSYTGWDFTSQTWYFSYLGWGRFDYGYLLHHQDEDHGQYKAFLDRSKTSSPSMEMPFPTIQRGNQIAGSFTS